jgi:hypothetical protein
MARLEPAPDGLRLHLDADEVSVLVSLTGGLADRLRDVDTDLTADPVVDRLAPEVSRGDADVDRELRAMLRPELLATRSDRLDDLVTALGRWSAADGTVKELLSRPDAMKLIEALNDVRLALAVTIGYEQPSDAAAGPTDREPDAMHLLDALAWLQGGLIEFVEGED